ncbi:hypothetical protein JW835_04700 [bacterium]|nr:hypothetical protein [bacterium]
MKLDKRPYAGPRIERVKLIPEEAVLTGCKATVGTQGSGKTNGKCQSQWLCNVIGS